MRYVKSVTRISSRSLTDKAGSVSAKCVSPVCATMHYLLALLSAACCVGVVLAQTAGAPAPVAATPTLYQRPNNSDCVTTTSSVTNFFPLQFQIAGSSTSTTQQAQVNVRFALPGVTSVLLHTNYNHFSSLPAGDSRTRLHSTIYGLVQGENSYFAQFL